MFVKKDDITLNTSQFNKESKNQVQLCEEEFKAEKARVIMFTNDIATKFVALCNAWITICSDLKDVSMPRE